MELSVLVEQTAEHTFRASSGEPMSESVQADTRDKALEQLRQKIEHRVRNGVEVVTLHIRPQSAEPVWPADDFTADWLAGIAAARDAANARPDPWETDDGAAQP